MFQVAQGVVSDFQSCSWINNSECLKQKNMMSSQQSSGFSFGHLHRIGISSNEPSELMDNAPKVLPAGVKITRINKAFQKGSARRIAEDVPSNVIYQACRTIQGRKWLLSQAPAQESVVPGQAETPSNEDFMKPVQIDLLRGNCSLTDLKQQLTEIVNPEQRFHLHLAEKYHKQDLTSTGTTDVFQMDSNIDWKVIREVQQEDQLISLAPHSLRTTNDAHQTHQSNTILQKGLSQRQTKKDPTNQWTYQLRGMKRSMHEIGENNLKEICLTNSHHGEDHGQKSPYFEVYNDNIHRVRVNPVQEQSSMFNLEFRDEGRSEHHPRKPLILESLNNSSSLKREIRNENQQQEIEDLRVQNKFLSEQQKLFEGEFAEFEQRMFVELQSMQSKMGCLEKSVSECNRELSTQQSLAEMREKDRNLKLLEVENANLKAIVNLKKDPIPLIHLLGIFAVVAAFLILALGRRAVCQ